MPHGGVGSQELPVEEAVTGLGEGQLLGEEGEGSPGTSNQLLKNISHMQV